MHNMLALNIRHQFSVPQNGSREVRGAVFAFFLLGLLLGSSPAAQAQKGKLPPAIPKGGGQESAGPDRVSESRTDRRVPGFETSTSAVTWPKPLPPQVPATSNTQSEGVAPLAKDTPKPQTSGSVGGNSEGEKAALNSVGATRHKPATFFLPLIAAMVIGTCVFALDLRKRFRPQLGLGVYHNWYCYGFLASAAVFAAVAYMSLDSLAGMVGNLGGNNATRLSEVLSSAGFIDVLKVVGGGGGARLLLASIGRFLPQSQPSPKPPGDNPSFDYRQITNLVFDFVYEGINEHVKDKLDDVVTSMAQKYDWSIIQSCACWLLKDEIQNGGLAEDAGRKAIGEISEPAAMNGPNDDRNRKEYALRTAIVKTSFSRLNRRLAREPLAVTT